MNDQSDDTTQNEEHQKSKSKSLIVKKQSFDFPLETQLTSIHEQQGTQILEQNEFIRDLINLTNSAVFRNFYLKYFDKASESTDKVTLLYLHLYYYLEEKYTNYNKPHKKDKKTPAEEFTVPKESNVYSPLSDEMKAYMLTKVMSDPQIVRDLVKMINNRGEVNF